MLLVIRIIQAYDPHSDSSELRAFAADLHAAGSGIAARVRPVVRRGAVKIKKQLRSEMGASRHFKGITPAIDYSNADTDGAIGAEIGPRTGSPGSLANIAYFGGARGGGTVPDPKGALDAEVPHFEKALSDVLGDLLR